jgi:hypothetical protein
MAHPAPSSGEWAPGPLLDAAGLLGVRVGAWNHFGYPGAAPAAGEHSAEAITAGHGAIEVIDQIIGDLHGLRSQLIGEIRADQDATAARVDAMLAGSRAGREARS